MNFYLWVGIPIWGITHVSRNKTRCKWENIMIVAADGILRTEKLQTQNIFCVASVRLSVTYNSSVLDHLGPATLVDPTLAPWWNSSWRGLVLNNRKVVPFKSLTFGTQLTCSLVGTHGSTPCAVTAAPERRFNVSFTGIWMFFLLGVPPVSNL